MSVTVALASCVVCNHPVSADCRCRVCNGRLHCFCAVPEGLEGHGGVYLCSADCQLRGVEHPPTLTPTHIVVYQGDDGAGNVPECADDGAADQLLPPLVDANGNANYIVEGGNVPPPLNDVFENFDETASVENDADPHVHCDATFARHLTTNHPMKKIERKKHFHKELSLEAKQQAMEQIADYIRELFNLPFCFNRDGNWFSKCTCLKSIILDHDSLNAMSAMLCK